MLTLIWLLYQPLLRSERFQFTRDQSRSLPPLMQVRHASRCAYSFLKCEGSASSAATERYGAMQSDRASQSAASQPMANIPCSSQPRPNASAFLAPPVWPMYMLNHMPRPLTQPPFMQAQFEELARQRQDIEARELEVQRMSRTRNLNAVRDARVRSVTSFRGSKCTSGKEQAPGCVVSQLASHRSQTPPGAPPSGIEVISTGVSQTVAPHTTCQDGASQNMETMV